MMTLFGPKHSIAIAALVAGIFMVPMVHGQSGQPAIGDGIDGLKTWLDLARQHTPGQLDEALRQERRIEVERHFALALDLEALIQFIRYPTRARLDTGRRYSVPEQELLKKMATRERAAGTTDSLLRKVALLESDSVMLSGRERYVLRPFSGLPQDMIFSLDGVSLEAVATPPNWQIGRLAIGAMSDKPDVAAWARLWYEATTAFLFADRVLAVLPKHLAQRRLEFPQDAGAWFDEGCHFEYLAGARFQQAMEDSREKRFTVVPHDRGGALDQARRMFEDALKRDPQHPEARVRLARVKALKGDAKSAARELTAVHPFVSADPVLRYLAYLFLGAAQESAGDDAAAMTAYREAVNLFPSAQSPRVSLARLERPGADSSADPLETLLLGERRSSEDPWLAYHTGPARRSRSLAAELWRASARRN